MASLMNPWLEWFKAGILYMRCLKHRVRAMVLIDIPEARACLIMTTDAAVLFGTLGAPPSGRWRPLSPQAWTCVGVLAIPLWATWPTLALRTLEMPHASTQLSSHDIAFLLLGH